MTSILGPYYAPHHHWQQDRDYMRALDPAWARIHQPDALAVHEVTKNAPNARIMLRSWDIDDNNGERKREMYDDPKGAARKHLDMWRAKWDEIVAELRRNNWPYDESRWYIGLVNEPDPNFVPQVVEYSLEAMRLVKGTLIHLGLVCSSVGTFSKPSENGDGWAKFKPLEVPMREGGHILIAHEYWQPEGPNYGEDGGNLAWRHRHIPLDVPILIGESGANGYIYGRYSKNDDSGWRVTVKDPNVYAAQVREYIAGCDQRVVGVLLYMLDYHSKQWESFYTGPAASQLLAIKDTRPQVPSPFANKPVDTHLPSVGTGTPAGTIAYITEPIGANLRLAPITGQVITAIPYGEQIRIIGVMDTSGWLRVRYGDKEGYMAAQLVGLEPPQEVDEGPEPTPMPPHNERDNWTRAIAFVMGWEGEYQNVANDAGNWTGCAVGKGELKGTKYGISACSYPNLDIINITKEQAASIYYTDYWQRSTADRLEWPLCLAVFDTAVLHGVGTAQKWLAEVGPNPYLFSARRLRSYTKMENWGFWGKAWTLRVADLLEVMGK